MNDSKIDSSDVKLLILEHFRTRQRTATIEFLGAMLGTSLFSVSSAISELVDEGLVHLVMYKGKAGMTDRYDITERGKKYLENRDAVHND